MLLQQQVLKNFFSLQTYLYTFESFAGIQQLFLLNLGFFLALLSQIRQMTNMGGHECAPECAQHDCTSHPSQRIRRAVNDCLDQDFGTNGVPEPAATPTLLHPLLSFPALVCTRRPGFSIRRLADTDERPFIKIKRVSSFPRVTLRKACHLDHLLVSLVCLGYFVNPDVSLGAITIKTVKQDAVCKTTQLYGNNRKHIMPQKTYLDIILYLPIELSTYSCTFSSPRQLKKNTNEEGGFPNGMHSKVPDPSFIKAVLLQ